MIPPCSPARFRRRLLVASIATLLPLSGRLAAQDLTRVWSTSPATNNWNAAGNWTPANIPNSAGESASFGASTLRDLTLTSDVFIDGITFQANAPSYTIRNNGRLLYVQEAMGVTNNSSARPTFVAEGGAMLFAAGSASNSRFQVSGNGTLNFVNGSTAGSAEITLSPNPSRGTLLFRDTATAGTAQINSAGLVQFAESSSLDRATLGVGSNPAFADTSDVSFSGNSSAGNGIINLGSGGRLFFNDSATGGQASLRANSLAYISFAGQTVPSITVGSLSGRAQVVLGAANLIVGGNHESTVFSGFLEGTGSLTKVGAGSLTLESGSFYTGGTVLQEGTLVLGNRRALGTGTFTIQGGTLGHTGLQQSLDNQLVLAGDFTFAGGSAVTGLAFSRGADLGTGPRTITFAGGTGSELSILGDLTGTGGLITRATAPGQNRLRLESAAMTTFAGPLTVGANTTVALANTNSFAVNSNVQVQSGGTLEIARETQQVLGLIQLDQGSLLDVAARDQTFGSIRGEGTIRAGTGGRTTIRLLDGDFSGALQERGGSTTLRILGSTRLHGTSNHTGGTIVEGSTLYVSNGAALGAESGPLVLRGGMLLLDDDFATARPVQLVGTPKLVLLSSAVTFTGQVSGSGWLHLDGGARLNLTGANTYSGGTFVNNSRLYIASDASLGSPTSNLQLTGGTLGLLGHVRSSRTIILGGSGGTIDTNGFNMLSRGPVVGTDGGLNKMGAGTLTLNGQTRYGGPTRILGGTLVVNSSVMGDVLLIPYDSSARWRPQVDAETFARRTLAGTGRIGGSVYNPTGTVSPGNSPGTLTIDGNYLQGRAGELLIEIGGRSAGESDLLRVGGRAELDGTLRVVTLDGFRPRGSDRFTFLTAGGGVEGEFAQTLLTDSPLLRAQVEYTGRTVELTFERGTIRSLFGREGLDALTPNQSTVAGSLDRGIDNARLTRIFDELDVLDAPAIPRALDLIAPDELSAMYEIAIGTANTQAFNLDRHLSDLRAGARGFSAGRLSLQQPARMAEKNILETDGKADAKKDIFTPAEDNRWSTFLAGSGEFINIQGDFNSPDGYDITTGGFTLGTSYRAAEGLAVGAFVGYAGTGAELAGDGHILVNSGKLGLYATAYGESWYGNAMIAGGYNSYDTKRQSLGGSTHGDTDGGEFSGLLTGGYDFRAGGVSFGPTVEANYTRVAYSSFRERGSAAPLEIEGNESDSLRTRLGARIFWQPRPTARVQIRPELNLAWQHEWADRSRQTDATFGNGAGSEFRVEGPRQGRDALVVNASVSIGLGARCSTYLAYDGILGRDRYETHTVSGGLRVSF